MNWGTLQTRAAAGLFVTAGLLENKKLWQVYLYTQPQVYAVAYNTTLQGGVFDHDSPYTIPAKDVSRITLGNRVGIVAGYRQLRLEYAWFVLTHEFAQGHSHAWGRIAASWLW